MSDNNCTEESTTSSTDTIDTKNKNEDDNDWLNDNNNAI